MTFDDYLLELFYLIDSELEAMNLSPRQLRSRGPQPRLYDSEVITMELAGEFQGIDADKAIWAHFRRYHAAEFPMLAVTDRTTFTRQAAGLWRVKQLLHERVASRLLPLADAADAADAADGGAPPPPPPPLWLFDSFPLRVCRFKRAPRHKLFRGHGAAFGHDPTGERLFYGYRVHLRCSDRGVCCAATLAPGNVTDRPLVDELLPDDARRGEGGRVGIGDRNYWDPDGHPSLLRRCFALLAPFRKKSSDPTPARSKMLGRLRQVIEPVIGQLAERFHCQRTRARDLWHLCARLARKLLSHTTAMLLNWRHGNPPLQLNLLIDE